MTIQVLKFLALVIQIHNVIRYTETSSATVRGKTILKK